MSREVKPSSSPHNGRISLRVSAAFSGLRPLTALTACAALSAWADPALARTGEAPVLLEVDAPMPPPHIVPANANRP
jgi:hypothetical protein